MNSSEAATPPLSRRLAAAENGVVRLSQAQGGL